MNAQIPPAPWYKQFWPWFIIAIPLSAVVAGIITIWIAMNHNVEVVSDNYYQEGVDINKRLRREKDLAAANISANILFSDNPSRVTLFLKGTFSDTYPELSLHLQAPGDPAKDRSITLKASNASLFKSDLPQPVTGRYYLTLGPVDRSWQLKQEIRLPSTQPLQVQ